MADQQARVERSRRIAANVHDVSALLENVSRTHEWNPLVNRISLGQGQGRGVDSTVRWEARLAGIRVSGSSRTVAWEPGAEYAWRSTDEHAGLGLEGRFRLTPVDEETDLAAIVTYRVPSVVGVILDHAGLETHIGEAVDRALSNIDALVRTR